MNRSCTSCSLSSRAAAGIVILLLAVHGVLCVTSVLKKSPTFDEMVHVTAGYAYWTQEDFRFDPEGGVLPNRWAALPLLLMDLRFPAGAPDPGGWKFHQDFFYGLGNDGDRMLLHSRAMTVLFSLGLGLVVFFWSRSLFGLPGGLVSLVLYSFSPTMAAHGRLATADTAAALFFLSALWAVWAAMDRRPGRFAILAGLLGGCLAASKASWVVLPPVALALFCLRAASLTGWRRRLRFFALCAAGLAAALIAACAVIWALYGFRYAAAPPGASPWPYPLVRPAHAANAALTAAQALMRFHALPESFLLGWADVFGRMTLRDGFLNGHYSINGWWWFFPFCFAVKTPLPLLGILALAGFVLARPGERRALRNAAPLLVFFLVYAASAMASGMNIGHRHILPLYPVLFILCGAVTLLRANRVWTWVLTLAAGLFVFQSLAIWPHYLAYFNEAAGGPEKGYRRLVDSSLDWGQDLPALAAWLKKNRMEGEPVHLSYFGTGAPAHYGIKHRELPPQEAQLPGLHPLEPGLYCISATHLQQCYTGVLGPWSQPFEDKYQELSRGLSMALAGRVFPGQEPEIAAAMAKFKRARFARLCHALKMREPDAMAGYSILIYRVDAKELHKALYQPLSSLPQTRNVKGAGPYTLY